jgi:hypothetical protein
MHNGQLTIDNSGARPSPTAGDAERAAGISGRSTAHYAGLLAKAQRDYDAAAALHARAMRAMVTYDDAVPEEADVIYEILDDVESRQAAGTGR